MAGTFSITTSEKPWIDLRLQAQALAVSVRRDVQGDWTLLQNAAPQEARRATRARIREHEKKWRT
jgi:hypothetical protein